MMYWKNLSPKVPSVTENSGVPKPIYGNVPQFQQTSGVKPGSSPSVPHTAAPASVNTKSILDALPTIFNIGG